MAQEIIEKRRSSARTPRATQPVLSRMPPKSIRKILASKKIVIPLRYDNIFPDFSTVAHALHGIKEKYRKSVDLFTALRTRWESPTRLKSGGNSALKCAFGLRNLHTSSDVR